MKDLRVGFLTSDGERFNNLGKAKANEWIADAVTTEIQKQKQSITGGNYVVTMDMYLGMILMEGKINKKFKVINDPDAEIYPGETFKGLALFDGGVSYDSSKNKATYLDSAKLGVYEVPVVVDETNTVQKKAEFIFGVKKVQVDANNPVLALPPPVEAKN